ncbi:transglutaminase domain-containing protein, partial [bacterium]|nr:transglutaminase domain-containing protein [bacterium]
NYSGISSETNSWVLVPGKQTDYSVNIGCYLPRGHGLLPLPHGTARLDNLPAYLLYPNESGAVFAEGPDLVVFDARFGPGASLDSAPERMDVTDIPRRELDAVRQTVDRLELRGKSLNATRAALADYFQTNFTYSTYQGRSSARTNDTPLTRFLLKSRSGHCEYFATATVLLLREAGFPARYAVGYAVHEKSGTDSYVVRARDAHAWTLVWNEANRCWEDFDTTPASWVQEEQPAAHFQWLKDAWSRVKYEISRFRWGQSRLREYILWSVVPIMLVLAWQVFSSGRRKRRRTTAGMVPPAPVPGLDSEFYRVERALARRGLARPVRGARSRRRGF